MVGSPSFEPFSRLRPFRSVPVVLGAGESSEGGSSAISDDLSPELADLSEPASGIAELSAPRSPFIHSGVDGDFIRNVGPRA